MPRNSKPRPTAREPRRRAARGPRRGPAVISIRGSITDPLPWGRMTSSSIGPEVAIKVSSIFGVVRWIAQAVAICPIHLMRELPDGRREKALLPCSYTLRRRPNRWQSSFDFYCLQAFWTALHGNGFARVIPGDRGWMTELRPMHPSRVKLEQLDSSEIRYQFFDEFGKWITLDQSEVLHWRWISDNGLVGHAPSEMCSTSIALARKLDTAATAFWDNSARPDMVLETDQRIPDEAVDALRAALHEVYGGAGNRGKAAVLPAKTRLKPIESNSMEANQFQELRDAILPDVCRHWGVPSTLLGDHRMAKYATVEQEHLSAQVWCLLPWARRMESPIDLAIQPVHGDNVYAKLDTRGVLRADTAGRAALYQALWNMGAITPNEIRDREDFELLTEPAANQTYVQLGFSTLTAAASQAAAAGVTEPMPAAQPVEDLLQPAEVEDSPGESVAEAAGFTVGQRVWFDADSEGVIEHLMVDGVLGLEGSPFALSATPEDPVASVRLYVDGEPTEFTIGKRVRDLSATPPDGGTS